MGARISLTYSIEKGMRPELWLGLGLGLGLELSHFFQLIEDRFQLLAEGVS